jgi:hypothetical protein
LRWPKDSSVLGEAKQSLDSVLHSAEKISSQKSMVQRVFDQVSFSLQSICGISSVYNLNFIIFHLQVINISPSFQRGYYQHPIINYGSNYAHVSVTSK